MSNKPSAVLIVEDDETLREMLRTILERQAVSLEFAADGERAIEMLRERPYDVVVLDLMLPKKNGFLVAEAIELLAHRPRLIVLSAIARYFHDRFPAGTVILQKPYEISKLADAVNSVRAESRDESSLSTSK